MMTQADMVLVKNLFSPQDAGFYASASVLGKAVIYLPGAIVLALFPMVAESNALRISSGSLLRKALVITLALSGGMALALSLFPTFVIETLFGARYLEAAGVLRYFGLAMLPMALLLILMNYFIAKGRTLFSYAMGLGAVIEVALILAFHSSLTSVIWAIMGTGGVVLALGFVLVYVEGRIERREFGLCGEHR
jgi:O-antigen/teichoic acid export membrane protein